MKIAFFEIKDWQEEYIRERIKGHELYFTEEKLTEKNASEFKDYDVVSVFIYSKVSKEVIGKLENLKFVTTRSTGFDHIDLEVCKEKNVSVSNVPFYGENTVAEHTMALILSLSRNLQTSFDKVHRGDFSLEGIRGFDLKGRTLGVIGTGHIGLHVVRMAKGFEMDIIAFDINKDKEKAEELGFEYVEFDTLLQESDIVTLHAPLNEHTKHMINKDNINDMKKGSYIVNTSRGGLVETEALIKGLQDGTIAGAALDVLEEEKFIDEEIELLSHLSAEKQKNMLQNHILLRMPNVIITPHNAFNSQEALERILNTTIENIKTYIKGKPIHTLYA